MPKKPKCTRWFGVKYRHSIQKASCLTSFQANANSLPYSRTFNRRFNLALLNFVRRWTPKSAAT